MSQTDLSQPQISVTATYMRGGTSKGIFINENNLPAAAQQPGKARDQLLLRITGSPDPYGQQIDGMGGATSSTSKVVLVGPATKEGHDVDYTFCQIAIDKAFVDYSGNCGNLTAAVGSFAIAQGLVSADKVPENGICTVNIWQKNIQKTIITHIPMKNGQVQEMGDFYLDGVAFPAAEVVVEFLDPADSSGSMLPTGNLVDDLEVPGIGTFKATFISAGIPTMFLNAADIGYTATELQKDINGDADKLAWFETVRAHGAVKMGLIKDVSEAADRQHTPKIAFVAPPAGYTTSSGKALKTEDIDLCVRALSMGKLHHAMMGTASVAIATAAAIPGTLVNLAAGGGERSSVTFGHASGTLKVGAEAKLVDGEWQATKAVMSRSARRIMQGEVLVPADTLEVK